MSQAGSLEGKLIILIERHDASRFFISEFLARRGARVLSSASVGEGTRLIQQHRPSVVLTETSLADRKGFDLLREIRAFSSTKVGNFPVIAMLSFGGMIEASQAIAAGFQRCLNKPFSPEELCKTINSVL